MGGRRGCLIKIEHQRTRTLGVGRGDFRGTGGIHISTIHVTRTKHQPIGIDVRNFLFDGLNDVKGGAGTIVEDAAKGCGTYTDIVSEDLLGHVLRLHNLSDSILFDPFLFLFTKVKQKNEINNNCRKNLRFNNFSLQFNICKSKDDKCEYSGLELQTRI